MTSSKGIGRFSISYPNEVAISTIHLVVTELRIDGEVGTTSFLGCEGSLFAAIPRKLDVENSSMYLRVAESRWRVMANPAFLAAAA